MNDYAATQMHCARSVKALLDAIDDIVLIAGSSEPSYRIAQSDLPDMQVALERLDILIGQLKKAPNVRLVK